MSMLRLISTGLMVVVADAGEMVRMDHTWEQASFTRRSTSSRDQLEMWLLKDWNSISVRPYRQGL